MNGKKLQELALFMMEQRRKKALNAVPETSESERLRPSHFLLEDFIKKNHLRRGKSVSALPPE